MSEQIQNDNLRGPLKICDVGGFVNMMEERHTKMSVSQYSPPPFCMTPRRIALRWRCVCCDGDARERSEHLPSQCWVEIYCQVKHLDRAAGRSGRQRGERPEIETGRGCKRERTTIQLGSSRQPPPPLLQTACATVGAVPFATYGRPQKADRKDGDVDSLVNATCCNKTTESANYPVTSQSPERGKLVSRGGGGGRRGGNSGCLSYRSGRS